jgi:hypothetical protein
MTFMVIGAVMICKDMIVEAIKELRDDAEQRERYMTGDLEQDEDA